MKDALTYGDNTMWTFLC